MIDWWMLWVGSGVGKGWGMGVFQKIIFEMIGGSLEE